MVTLPIFVRDHAEGPLLPWSRQVEAAELFGVAADDGRVEAPLDGLRDRVRERLRRRLVDQKAGFAGDYGFERTTAGERDDRPSARLCLERRDPEVLFTGQQRDGRASIQFTNFVVRSPSEEAATSSASSPS